jgi:SpoIID/LytB domain protein
VISRSWLLAQIDKQNQIRGEEKDYQTSFTSDDEVICWYDREDHVGFDVCADDHCQRYQGITRAFTSAAAEAVFHTSGEVLVFNEKLCDARFSKCCGGITEVFENTWEPVVHPYLSRIYDHESADKDNAGDLRIEDRAKSWILSSPPAFCNTADKDILSQVLNDYDLSTQRFYRWSVNYSQEEVTELVHKKTGIDFGLITELMPLERGVSGRLIRLQIKGTKKTMIIGKELEIRKALSPTHLYSSAFIPEKVISSGKVSFVLNGAGWGHGVGLCQIGAAVMGSRGYKYEEILGHYFRGAELIKLY